LKVIPECRRITSRKESAPFYSAISRRLVRHNCIHSCHLRPSSIEVRLSSSSLFSPFLRFPLSSQNLLSSHLLRMELGARYSIFNIFLSKESTIKEALARRVLCAAENKKNTQHTKQKSIFLSVVSCRLTSTYVANEATSSVNLLKSLE
jgi:hypothetical protein